MMSLPEINDHLCAFLVAPLTHGSRPAPFRVATITSGDAGPILLDQIRGIDRERLAKSLGKLDQPTLSQALTVLRELFVG